MAQKCSETKFLNAHLHEPNLNWAFTKLFRSQDAFSGSFRLAERFATAAVRMYAAYRLEGFRRSRLHTI